MLPHMTQHNVHMKERAGSVRLLRPGELPLYLNHLLRLDEEARGLRFDHMTDDAAIQAYCLTVSMSGAQILGAFIDGALRGTVEFNPNPDPRLTATELMFAIEPAFQRKGLGTALMAKALEMAYPKAAIMFCRENSHGMIALAETFGATIWRDKDYLALAITTDDGGSVSQGDCAAHADIGNNRTYPLSHGSV